jgi:hypothetical protein
MLAKILAVAAVAIGVGGGGLYYATSGYQCPFSGACSSSDSGMSTCPTASPCCATAASCCAAPEETVDTVACSAVVGPAGIALAATEK